VRKLRDEALKSLDAREKQKEIGEDEKFRSKNDVQKHIDETNKKIEEMGSTKEKEIMTV
jgi:ribosome recycling factor